MEEIEGRVDQVNPDRVFIDAITILRHLTGEQYQFREQFLSLPKYLGKQGATVLFTSETSSQNPDVDLQFMADRIIELNSSDRSRALKVNKFRGSDYQERRHSLEIKDGGSESFPGWYRKRRKKASVKSPLLPVFRKWTICFTAAWKRGL